MLPLGSLRGWISCELDQEAYHRRLLTTVSLFGYDQGVMGALLDLPSFVTSLPERKRASITQSLIRIR